MNTASSVKVIIYQSRGEVSLVEKTIIDYVSTASFEPKKTKFKNFFYTRDITQLFNADATMHKSQFLFHKKCSPQTLMYNHFVLST